MPIVPIVITAAKVARTVYKHRKAIYAVLTAQDRYISKSFKYGGYGKATSYGVRSGALAGSIIGAFINEADDSPGNAVPKKTAVPKTSTPHKTRSGFSVRYNSRNRSGYNPNRFSRCARPRRFNTG